MSVIDFPLIDTHLHLWDIKQLSYPWLEDMPLLKRSFSLADYHKACGNMDVERMIFMQCECDPSQYKEEVEWVSGLAREEPGLQGIISWAPLEEGEAARADLEELKSNPLVKGVRRIIQYETDLDFCLQPAFIRGVNMLSDYGFTFDICIAQKHNQNVIRFLRECTGVPMILDHIGKPDIKNNIIDPWRDEIREIADFPDVYCKLSSLATEADHDNWTVDELKPYVDHIIDCFGIDRLIFGSDWPVVTLAADLETAVSTMLELLKGLSEEELQKLFYHNAMKFYGL